MTSSVKETDNDPNAPTTPSTGSSSAPRPSSSSMLSSKMNDIAMAVRQHVPTKPHRTSYFGKTYSHCFTGSDFIDYLQSSKIVSSRVEALQLGQLLMHGGNVQEQEQQQQQNLFEHVTRDYSTLLDDSTVYYRFLSPNERGGTFSNRNKISSINSHMSWSTFLESSKLSTGTNQQNSDPSISMQLSPKDQQVTSTIWPLDKHNIELLNNVHPLNWQDPVGDSNSSNPKTTGRRNKKYISNLYDMVVIGGGPAGLITAAGSAGIGGTIRVALIEKLLLGGDCLNVGCVPSKTLIHAANLVHSLCDGGKIRRMNDAGITYDTTSVQIEFSSVMERVRRVRSQISKHDSAHRYSQELGVDVYIGPAKFISPNSVMVNGQTLSFKRAAIATGASPTIIPEMDNLMNLFQQQFTYTNSSTGSNSKEARPMIMTNETIFNLTKAPNKLVVIGSGVIGCELGQAMQRLGVPTTILGRSRRILNEKEDDDLAKIIQDQMICDGIEFRLHVTKYMKIELTGVIHAENGYPEMKIAIQEDGINQVTELFCDTVLIAAGRHPNVQGMDLELANVQYDPQEGLKVNDKLRTSNSRIYGVGDCCDTRDKYTHAADFMARAVIRNALFFGKERVSSLLIPHATFTSPEIASVGLSTSELQAKGIVYRIIEKYFNTNDRAIADDATQGLVRFRISHKTDEIYGATIVGNNNCAGNMISEITLAMQTKIGLGKLASVIHPYPTTAETIRQCGDLYNKTRLTTSVKSLLRTIVQLQR